MDLSRWHLPRLRRIAKRYRGLEDYLHDVLEGEQNVAEAHFEITSDFESIESLASPRLKPETVFEALAPFFEAGLYVTTGGAGASAAGQAENKLKSMFLFGKVLVVASGQAAALPFPLPEVPAHGVIKGRVQPLLEAFGLELVPALVGASVFAFRPLPPSASVGASSVASSGVFLLVCNRPHPWQVGAIERTFHSVSAVFERSEALRQSRARSFFKGRIFK